jgi:hypothetical protein
MKSRSARLSIAAAATLAASATLASCASAQRDEAASAAEAFYTAIAASDGQTACDLLTPSTRQEVEEASGDSCPAAIVELLRGLDAHTGADPVHVEAFGTMAQVRTEADTAFLHRFHGHWRVVAAGCETGPAGVYDCHVQGS